jgi:hypothetical protein
MNDNRNDLTRRRFLGSAVASASGIAWTAARLGVPRYRMKYYKYDLRRPVLDQAKEAAKDPEPVVKAIRDDLTTLRRWLS